MEDTEKRLEKGNEKMRSLYSLRKHAAATSRSIVILGISGFDSSLFAASFVDQLLSSKTSLIVVPDSQAIKAVDEEALLKRFSEAAGNSELVVLTDKDEWEFWGKGMVVLHIYLRNLVDSFLMAPMSAHILSKIANGLCDDLLTCLCRAWNLAKPLVCCPSMPFDLWGVGSENPITKEHIAKVQSYYKARVIGYSRAEKGGAFIEEKTFESFEPLLSPITEEVSETEKRLRMAVELFTKC
eukprot:TRINITY_DN1309_c0_g2_i2.p1 TRINITY_DN1309_c0_g2~~TRINITY_DN1309_c0_g2_i2.p1  ORF type:complete len:240 (-),score=76.29 TRINITY_DN1309_c0_g2_i2:59-778(-)